MNRDYVIVVVLAIVCALLIGEFFFGGPVNKEQKTKLILQCKESCRGFMGYSFEPRDGGDCKCLGEL